MWKTVQIVNLGCFDFEKCQQKSLLFMLPKFEDHHYDEINKLPQESWLMSVILIFHTSKHLIYIKVVVADD